MNFETECWNQDKDRIQIEVAIHPRLNQRIDVLDSREMVAYEFKVSGKNATAEFYKDIVKAILWNEERDNKIKKLVFITEESRGDVSWMRLCQRHLSDTFQEMAWR